MEEKKWTGKSKGNKYGYLFFIYTIRLLPLSFNYAFLKFVSYFYFLFNKEQKRNLNTFYSEVFPDFSKEERNQLIKDNFYYLAQTIVDRVAFLTNKKEVFEFDFDGHENITAHLKDGKGLIFLGSHLGNWEIAGEMLREKGIQAKVNVLLLDQEREQVKEMMASVKRPNSFEIIPIKEDFSHIIRMRNAIDNGEIVCVLGDRFMENSRTLDITFFNNQIQLPLGIFKFIEKFKVPTLFFYNVKIAETHYKLHAIQTDYEIKAEEIATNYGKVLESMVNQYPKQFYNYFLFFDKE